MGFVWDLSNMGMEHVRFETFNRHELAGILHTPEGNPRAGLIIMHGVFSSKDQLWMQSLGEKLSKELQLAVLRFDFFAHGESEGTLQDLTYHELILNAQAAIGFLRNAGIPKVFVLGHSLGGGVGLLVASQQKVNGLIAISPVSNPPSIVKRIVKREKGSISVEMGPHVADFPLAFVDSALQFPRESFAGKISCPTCVIHGTKDPILFSKDSESLMPLLVGTQDKELHLLKDADHVFTHRWNEVFEIVVDWLKRHA